MASFRQITKFNYLFESYSFVLSVTLSSTMQKREYIFFEHSQRYPLFLVQNVQKWRGKKMVCFWSFLTCFMYIHQERQDLAERVMITRLHLYGRWIKVMQRQRAIPSKSWEKLAQITEIFTYTYDRCIWSEMWPYKNVREDFQREPGTHARKANGNRSVANWRHEQQRQTRLRGTRLELLSELSINCFTQQCTSMNPCCFFSFWLLLVCVYNPAWIEQLVYILS